MLPLNDSIFHNTLSHMAGKFYEFVHVSEMLQTVFGLTVVLLAIAQFLMARHELWIDMIKKREIEDEEYVRWVEN